jgi:hypothetical protein
MNCDDLKDSYELYALGIAEEPERSEIAVHLERGCENCSAGVRKSMELVTMIAVTAPAAQPSRALRRRVVSLAQPERQVGWRWQLAMGLLTLGLLAVVAHSLNDNRRLGFALTALRQELRLSRESNSRMQGELSNARQVLEFLKLPETRQVTFGAGPKGRIFVNPGRGVLLLASSLPALGPGKTYEFWLIPKGKSPLPAGLFESNASGEAVHAAPNAAGVEHLAAVAISVEPEGGSPQPTSTPILVVNLSGML